MSSSSAEPCGPSDAHHPSSLCGILGAARGARGQCHCRLTQLLFQGRLSRSPAPTLYPCALPGTRVGKRNPCVQAGGVLSFFLRPGTVPRDVPTHCGIFVSCPPIPSQGILISLQTNERKEEAGFNRKGQRLGKKSWRGWGPCLCLGLFPRLDRPPSLNTSNQHLRRLDEAVERGRAEVLNI